MRRTRSRLVLHRSRIDAGNLPEPPPRRLALDDWLTALADPAGTLELVAERPAYWEFADEWSCGWRRLGFHLLFLIVQGRGRLRFPGGAVHRLGAGSSFWLPPGEEHRMELSACRLYFIRMRLVRDGRSLHFGGPFLRDGALHLLPAFQGVSDDLRVAHPRLDVRLRARLALIASDGDDGAEATSDGPLGPAQRRRLVQLADEFPGIAPASLAHALRLSPTAFTRAFRRSFACTPRRWLADRRIRAVATALLTDPRPVDAVSADAGFANPSQFARRFRSTFGLSPAAWRRSQGL